MNVRIILVRVDQEENQPERYEHTEREAIESTNPFQQEVAGKEKRQDEWQPEKGPFLPHVLFCKIEDSRDTLPDEQRDEDFILPNLKP